MKKVFSAAALILSLGACAEPTSAPVSADLSPVFAKGGKPRPGSGGATGPTNIAVADSFTFEIGAPSTVSSFTTELQPGVTGIASDPEIVTAPLGQRFLGRFFVTATDLILTTPAGHAKYYLAFDLYTIGSWDGKGKQAQSGAFDANIVQIQYRCAGDPAVHDLFSSTFSNQLTVQQDFPAAFGLGGNKAGTGSFDKDALGYKDYPVLSNTPPFRSFGDISYRLAFGGDNPCGTAGISFIWGTSNPKQQSMHDESWGVDNVSLKLGT